MGGAVGGVVEVPVLFGNLSQPVTKRDRMLVNVTLIIIALE
jgi:hypothetical protein